MLIFHSYFTGTLHLLTSLLLVLTTYKQMCLQDFTQFCFSTFLIWMWELEFRHNYTSLVRLECGRRGRTEEKIKRTEARKCELWVWKMLDIVLLQFSFGTVLYGLQKFWTGGCVVLLSPLGASGVHFRTSWLLWGIPSSMYLLFKFRFHSMMLVKEQSVTTDAPSSRLA